MMRQKESNPMRLRVNSFAAPVVICQPFETRLAFREYGYVRSRPQTCRCTCEIKKKNGNEKHFPLISNSSSQLE